MRAHWSRVEDLISTQVDGRGRGVTGRVDRANAFAPYDAVDRGLGELPTTFRLLVRASMVELYVGDVFLVVESAPWRTKGGAAMTGVVARTACAARRVRVESARAMTLPPWAPAGARKEWFNNAAMMMQLDGCRNRPARRSAPTPARSPPRTMLGGALKKAVGGGIPGAVAMVLQVVLLMWLRTTVNYQMRRGGSLIAVMRLLYAEGGVARFYSGMSMALLQGPLSRFGDTAANAGMLALLEGSTMPVLVQTAFSSAAAAGWRVVITPLDTAKTMMQVEGARGLGLLGERVRRGGVLQLWNGALGATVATFLGHYPWFATNNWLESTVPPTAGRVRTLARRAFIGFCSSVVSDFVSNSTRVVKTFVQTSDAPVTYVEAATFILNRDGVAGLLWRGLAAKILCNGLSSVLFSVIWKSMMDRMEPKRKEKV